MLTGGGGQDHCVLVVHEELDRLREDAGATRIARLHHTLVSHALLQPGDFQTCHAAIVLQRRDPDSILPPEYPGNKVK